MNNSGSERTIEIKKVDLVAKIATNREAHITEYDLAVEAYKTEALKQIKQITKEVKNGSLKVHLKLTTPEDRRKEYDKLLVQFEWEQREIIELSQHEFNMYVHDEFHWAVQSRVSNAMYVG